MLELDYKLNFSAYLEQCLNKDKPELKCNGQCKLARKINDAGERDRKSDRSHEGNFHIVLSARTYFPDLKSPEPVPLALVLAGSLEHYPLGHIPPVFQPPRIS
jgi:hypothetical protein